MEQLLATFDAAALELMLQHGVKPSELQTRVTTALENASAGLPKLRVLHSGSYGGYGLSEEFETFIHSASSLAPFRRQPLDSGSEPPLGHILSKSDEQGDAGGFYISRASRRGSLPCVEQAPAHVPSLAMLCVIARTRPRDSSRLRSAYRPGDFAHVARLLDADMLVPFGRALAAKWPFLEQLARAYVSPGGAQCRKNVHSARDLVKCRQQLAEATSLRGRVEAALGPDQPLGSREWTGHPAYGMSSVLDKHEASISAHRRHLPGLLGAGGSPHDMLSRASLEGMSQALDENISQLTASVDSKAAAFDAVPFADAMFASASITLHEEKSSELSRMSVSERPSFCQAVEQHGEQHADVWKFQDMFDKSTMQYLMRCPEHVSQLLQTPDQAADDEVLQELALSAAGSRGCNLCVHLVPQLSEWGIEEYDGLEGVHLI